MKGDFLVSAQTPDAGKAPPRVHMAIYIRDLCCKYIKLLTIPCEFHNYTDPASLVKPAAAIEATHIVSL